jgi:hypothetical protein
MTLTSKITSSSLKCRRQAAPDPHLTGIVADCATAAGAKAVFEQVPELDILVNNLGIYGRNPAFEIDDSEWQRPRSAWQSPTSTPGIDWERPSRFAPPIPKKAAEIKAA